MTFLLRNQVVLTLTISLTCFFNLECQNITYSPCSQHTHKHTHKLQYMVSLSFYVDHFKSIYWICYKIASVLCLVFWWLGKWDPSFPTSKHTYTRYIGRRNLNHWPTREVPSPSIFYYHNFLNSFVYRMQFHMWSGY